MLHPDDLRSAKWLANDDFAGLNHRSRLKQAGYRTQDFSGKPVIAIINTWSEINPCHFHLRDR